MQGEKIEAWFVSQARRKYFGVESTAYLRANKFTQKSTHWQDELTAKYVFFTSEAIKYLSVLVNSNVLMLCCSSCCEITQNMVFQLLKNFELEINFE